MRNFCSAVFLSLFFISLVFLLTACQTGQVSSSDNQLSSLDISHYQKAEQFLPKNISQLAHNLKVNPNWIGETSRFWFSEKNAEKTSRFYLVTPETQKVEALFDHTKLASALSNSQQSWSAKDLSLTDFSIDDDLAQAKFSFNKKNYQCDLSVNLSAYQCSIIEEAKDSANSDETADKNQDYLSPDKKWLAQVIDWDLYLTNTNTKKRTRITFDGTEDYPYAVDNMNPQQLFNQPADEIQQQLSIYWSPDGQSLITHRLDRRDVGKLHLIQSVTGKGLRPRLYSYYYPLAGDEKIPQGDTIAVQLDTLTFQKIDMPQSLQTYYGGPIWGWWEKENNRFYSAIRGRANQSFTLYEYDAKTKKSRMVVSDANDKFIDPWVQQIYVLAASDQLIVSSERSGQQQLYRYQLSNGKLLNKVTQCDCFVRSIKGIDQTRQQLYFEASGYFSTETAAPSKDLRQSADPYFRYLYRVDLNGENQTLLTPEAFNHNVTLSPDFNYFVDTYSSPNQVPINQLKSTQTGETITPLGHPDISQLNASGWTPPESFSLLVDDNKTMVYGLIYKPSHFDPSKNYPVIDATYTGPHGFFTPKDFWSYYGQESALAELGFIVIKMDGRGTGKRDRAFHEVSYQNLAGGVDDHVYAIKQLAKQRSYMDITRVGIYGFSAGGYDTAQAMFRHADFFKVGVAASGNHDFRTDKTGWNETWLGYPANEFYDQQTNLNPELIAQLKGKLLLAHGELDENVNPAATMQLVDGLIKANKDFDLLLFPNQHHNLNYSDYFVRKRWDYFVQHLLNKNPPKAFKFELITK